MNNELTPEELFSKKIRDNPVYFIDRVLGLPLHEHQKEWILNSYRKINILRPGNRWGKTFVEACIHIWQCMCKPNLAGKVDTELEWLQTPYTTLNFGPEYEGARECLRHIGDIVEGRVMLPRPYWGRWGKLNNSKLKGWAITDNKTERNLLPGIEFVTGAKCIARSYSDMGTAFKAKAIAFISGDECADIGELWTFTNITLLPRLVSLNGILHFVGTVQPEGYDYVEMIKMAEDDMRRHKGDGKLFYVQKGRMYDNTFIDKSEIEKTEAIADPMLRMQIIEGEYVEAGGKFFGNERISNALDREMPWLECGLPGRKYIVGADFAGGKSKWGDYTVVMVWDYTEELYRLVYMWRIRGSEMSIPMQYERSREICSLFPGKFIIDGSALGGKNASAFLRDLRPISIDINPKQKAEMLSTLKVAFDGFQSPTRKRKLSQNERGIFVDTNPNWGLIKMPYDYNIWSELVNYKLEDKKLRNDIVMTMSMCIWWLEMRRPRVERKHMVEIDWNQVL
jgi:hypothetical protein